MPTLPKSTGTARFPQKLGRGTEDASREPAGGAWLYRHPTFGLRALGPERGVTALFCGTLTCGPKEQALGKRGLGAWQSSSGQHGHLERNGL